MATIDYLLRAAQLPASPSAKLDAEWLLAAALGKGTSYLRTWPDREVLPEVEARFAAYLERRRLGEPVAYILGRQGVSISKWRHIP
jgi:release factor glutamine methyltransferase